MRVLALTRYGRLGASSRLRTLQYVAPLARAGIELVPAPLFDDSYVDALYRRRSRVRFTLEGYARRIGTLLRRGGYDAVWIEKEALPWLPAFVELGLWPKRLPVVLDYDDAVFHRNDRHASPLVRALLGKKLDHLMARSALVVAGNDYLAERARSAGASHIEIVPTVVDLDRYRAMPRTSSGPPTIGWIGSPATAHYLDIVKPTLERLRAQVEFRAIAIGARPDQLAGSGIEAVAWSEDSEVQSLAACDIGIMPLPDDPWERGKCGYKLIQYMALGIPVVASPVGANRAIVGADAGFLPTDEQGWVEALSRLASDPTLRRRLGDAGRSRVTGTYSLAVQAPRLAGLLASLGPAV
jgi:glycosyltransferase involved in cell wall biosynthesis